MGGTWYPGVVECVSRVHLLLGHDFAPLLSEMHKECFDGLVGVAEVVFIEFFDVLLFSAVDNALDANVRDGPLEVKCLLELF